MPRLYKLSTKTINPQIGGGISPGGGMLSDSSRRISTPQVNVNANNTQYTDLPIAPEVKTDYVDQVINSGQILLDKTRELVDRRNSILAKEAILQYQNKVRERFYGTDKSKGYMHYQGIDANDNYQDYTTTVDNDFKEIVNSLDPAVREKALIQMTNVRNTYLNKGAVHNAQQIKVAEEQARFVANEQIKKEIEVSGWHAWSDGSVDAHLNDIKDPLEKAAAANELGTYTLYESYNSILSQTGNPIKAFENAAQTYNAIKDKLPEDSKQKLGYWLLGKQKEAETLEGKLIKEQTEEQRKAIADDAPVVIAQAIRSNNNDIIASQVDQIHILYKDDQIKASKLVVKSVRDGLLQAVSDYPDVPSKINAAQHYFSEIADKANLNAYEFTQLRSYVMFDIPKEIVKQQDARDETNITVLSATLADTKLEDFKPVEPPKDMLPENKKRWRSIQENFIKIKTTGIAPEQQTALGFNDTNFEAKISEGIVTDKDVRYAQDLLAKGQISLSTFKRAVIANKSYKERGGKKQPWQELPDYVNAKTAINNIYKYKLRKNKWRDKRIEDNMALLEQRSRIMILLEREAKRAYDDNRTFDAEKFMLKAYDAINEGKPLSPDWWK